MTLINFGPGPTKLPKAVLEQAAKEFVIHPKYGMSVTGYNRFIFSYVEKRIVNIN